MKAMPDIEINVHLTPVDYISRSVVHLSQQKGSIGKAFHLVNQNIRNVREMKDDICDANYHLDLIPFEAWKEKLTNSDNTNALKLLESLFNDDKKGSESILKRYAQVEATFDITNTKRELEKTNIKCTPFNRELMERYLIYFNKKGYIKK
jgi:thioester reductase-like protein